MTDGPGTRPGGAQPPAGTPSPRALGAMESAVRRVRASNTVAPDAPTPPDPYRPPVPVAPVRRPDGVWTRWTAGRSDRWLLGAVAVAAVAVVALAVALILSLQNGSTRVATPPVATVAPSGGGHHPAHNTPGTASSTTTSTTSTTSTTIAATPGGPPVIDSLSPSSGAAGQTITITGANFISSDGHIVAAFNGQVAPTSCPAQNTCTVTVPPSNGAPSAQVTITTAAGASNTVPFTYG